MLNTGYKIIVDNVSYYPPNNQKGTLKNINLEINSGEFISIIGGNAHGKTSLMNAIIGNLQKDMGKFSGTVTVENCIIDSPINKKLNGIGIVHQEDEYDLNEQYSIDLNVRGRFYNSNLPKSVIKEHLSGNWIATLNTFLREIFNDNNITPEAERLVGALSGGQKKLLSILMAVKLEHSKDGCRLLLLDEPFSSLDDYMIDLVVQMINTHTLNNQNNRKTTVILITHSNGYAHALKLSDRIIVISKGEIAQEIIRSERSKWRESYLKQQLRLR